MVTQPKNNTVYNWIVLSQFLSGGNEIGIRCSPIVIRIWQSRSNPYVTDADRADIVWNRCSHYTKCYIQCNLTMFVITMISYSHPFMTGRYEDKKCTCAHS
ncbi:hypothetical protein QTP88_000371 [Uroleucon formosanum]